MKTGVVAIALALAGFPVLAADPAPAALGKLLATTTTSSGQPIALPQGPVQVTATISEIGPGATTPVHRHPFPRYGYVMAGRLQVTNLETGVVKVFTTGEFVVDPVGQWHQGHALDGKPVRLLIIDQTPPHQSNMVLRDPPAKP